MLYLMTTLDDKTSTLVMTCDSAKAIWDSLISVLEQSSDQRLDGLLEEFFRLGRDSTEDIATFVAKLPELKETLKQQIENELSDRISYTLGSNFWEFRNGWEAMPSSSRTLKNLVKELSTID